MNEQYKNIEPPKEKEITLPLEEFERIFRERSALIEEMKRVFSISLRCAFAADFEGRRTQQWRRVDPYHKPITQDAKIIIRTFEEMVLPPPLFEPEARAGWRSDRQAILGDESSKRHLAEIIFKARDTVSPEDLSAWVSFVFSVDNKIAKRYWNEGQTLGLFAAPRDIQFHGIYIGVPRKEKRTLLDEAAKNEKFTNITIDPNLTKSFIEMLDQPFAACEDACAEIDRLGRELNIDPEKTRTLKRAVQEFAAYVKPEPTTAEQCFREIGRCFTSPHTFRHFAREWHGLQIDTDFYERSYAGECTFFHEVNVVDGKIVIDWTARQYAEFRREPYPFVYKIGDKKVRFGQLQMGEKTR